MDKEIYGKFIEAEKDGALKVDEVFNQLFSQYQSDYKKMADLLIVVKDRIEELLEDDNFIDTYLLNEAKINGRSNDNLSEEEYEDFCKLADNYSIIKESSD